MLEDIDTLTIAVPKGRVLEEIIPLFDIMKLYFFDNPFKSRKLIFKTSNPKIRIILLLSLLLLPSNLCQHDAL